MSGPPPPIAAVRLAVRAALVEHHLVGARVLVACSGGADSLALAAAAGFEVPRGGGSVGAVTVDHRLQPHSGQVAYAASQACERLGVFPATVVAVDVHVRSSGVEDAARTARSDAFVEVAQEHGAKAVLLGHTRDDQAEQVLLGLVRGSGARSLSGMPRARDLVGAGNLAAAGSPAADGDPALTLLRPFLGLSRQVTQDACVAAGVDPWHDPHNDDDRFTRVRARHALADLHERLGPSVGAALARSADLLRVDADALDELADTAYQDLGPTPWSLARLADYPTALRTRLWQRMATRAGSPPGSMAAAHLWAVDELYTNWHGQGPIDVPGGVRIHRANGLIWPQARPAG